MQQFRDDVEKLYNDAQVLVGLYRYINDVDEGLTLSQIHNPETGKPFAKWRPNRKGKEPNEIIAAYLKTLPQLPLSLVLADDLTFKLIPDMKSVFDVVYYALTKFVSFPTDLPIGYGDKTGMPFAKSTTTFLFGTGTDRNTAIIPNAKKYATEKIPVTIPIEKYRRKRMNGRVNLVVKILVYKKRHPFSFHAFHDI